MTMKSKEQIIEEVTRLIGSNVAKYRVLRGMSRREVGEALSEPISHQAIDNYEKGLSRIPSPTLAEIALFLGVTVPDLFEGVDVLLAGGVGVKAVPVDNRDERMIKSLHSINDPAMQDLVRNLVDALVKGLANNLKEINRDAR